MGLIWKGFMEEVFITSLKAVAEGCTEKQISGHSL